VGYSPLLDSFLPSIMMSFAREFYAIEVVRPCGGGPPSRGGERWRWTGLEWRGAEGRGREVEGLEHMAALAGVGGDAGEAGGGGRAE